jgi:hypothetical protein
MTETVNFRFHGDEEKAKGLRYFGTKLLATLHNSMKFNDLKQGRIERCLEDGSMVVCRSIFGVSVIDLFSPVFAAVGKEKKIIDITEDVSSVYYVVQFSYADPVDTEYGKTITRFYTKNKQKISDIVFTFGADHILSGINSQEWVVGDLIFILKALQDYKCFYNPITGKLEDYVLSYRNNNFSAVLVDGSYLYLVHFDDANIIRIKPIKNEDTGKYTFEREIFKFAASVYLEEGVFYYHVKMTDENSYSTVAVVNKDTGTFIIKDGYYKYTDSHGSTSVCEWFSPSTKWVYTNTVYPGIQQVYDMTVYYPNSIDTSHFVSTNNGQSGTVINYSTNHIKHSIFGKCFYINEKLTYHLDGSHTVAYTVFDCNHNIIVVTNKEGTLQLDLYKEWKNIVYTDDLFDVRLRQYTDIGYVDAGHHTIIDNVISTVDALYESFGLSTTKHIINSMVYLPGLENDSVIKGFLQE